MSWKITRRNEATFYEPPAHFDVRCTRLNNADEVNDGRVVFGLSHFLPGGGCEYGSNPCESIYYIVEGEMDITTDDGKTTTLHKGDSYHCGPDTEKGIKNNGPVTCQMLTIIVPPAAK
ncbi:Cupin 2 conserved barrel domain protein [Olsenella uli DSM 7084]|uniref:Cupin 2 conserved barrel domain protein n=1 Tax=Olsenella uli (strain ATCC 49627 / DSM 7084 / CCUG 31166 / CIP 109912 / JCM 12494 / LMG 11480 / NCIMB 702895 / VPI D76D-27C) TaxID=633147 RepID=E1QY42_OLSUV|nr:cupin domain-containing protein [Olsenella uli]ADK67306.1 Cupin 2 conserved barrel domain protein [Olsenella uli DSM 7084]KRO12055.1 cupin [Olsenella uli DSM 7084]MBS6418463.1 cupin domain-containing protein [Olsenella uli]